MEVRKRGRWRGKEYSVGKSNRNGQSMAAEEEVVGGVSDYGKN